MSKDDYSVLFDVLEALEYEAFHPIRPSDSRARRSIATFINNKSQLNNAIQLRKTANLPGYFGSNQEYVSLPLPKDTTIAVSRITVPNRNPLVIQLEILLARKNTGIFIIRFDKPHSREISHRYYHAQFSDSTGPKHNKGAVDELIDGLAGSYPALPIPAHNSIELLVGAVMALYGRSGMNHKLRGLDAFSRSRIRQARVNMIERCDPLGP